MWREKWTAKKTETDLVPTSEYTIRGGVCKKQRIHLFNSLKELFARTWLFLQIQNFLIWSLYAIYIIYIFLVIRTKLAILISKKIGISKLDPHCRKNIRIYFIKKRQNKRPGTRIFHRNYPNLLKIIYTWYNICRLFLTIPEMAKTCYKNLKTILGT